MARDYIIYYNGLQIRSMQPSDVYKYVSLFRFSKPKYINKMQLWSNKVNNDINNDIATVFSVEYNNKLIGAITLAYIKPADEMRDIYADANMMIEVPETKKYSHLAKPIAEAMIALCRETHIVDNLGVPYLENGALIWKMIEIVPKTA